MTLTVGSLFSGIGGIDLGLERAGMKVLWQVEIDPWCRAVLAKHWPGVERFEDVRSVGADNLPRVDILVGGFPCQDISSIGKGAGIEGKESGLWTEFARIVREIRPRYVLVENVPVLRSRGLDVVLGDLAASGYDMEWDCIPASAVGAPHRRDRIWIVAHAARDAVLGEAASERAIGQRARPGGEPVAFHGRLPNFGRWLTEPNVGRVAHGIPARVDRLRGLGNAVVPQVVEWIGQRIVEAEAEETVAEMNLSTDRLMEFSKRYEAVRDDV
jgi:DNA (cytosine-5)-methyltransferase 1